MTFMSMWLFASAPARAELAPPGSTIVNVASVSSAESDAPVSSDPATVTVANAQPARIEFLGYAPTIASPESELVSLGSYKTGPNPTDSAVALPLPVITGRTRPLDLTSPLPMHVTGLYHQGDAVFVRLVDRNVNRNPNVRESVFVTITDTVTTDVEIVQVTEDAPDSGVFIGYIPSAHVKSTTTGQRKNGLSASDVHDYSGTLEVVERSKLLATFTDPFTTVQVVSDAAIVDQISRVMDSFSGQFVNGAEVTVIDADTGLPATAYADDGLSSFPSTLRTGESIVDGSGRTQVFGPGEFRFPFLRPGNYRYIVKPPAGYAAPSTVADAKLQQLPNAPFALTDQGSRGEAFGLNPGPMVQQIDIPIDPAHVALWVSKTPSKDQVGVGDFLSYLITVLNTDAKVTGAGIRATDTLPVGFRYKKGSTIIDGHSAADPVISRDGRTLDFILGPIDAGAQVAIRFAVDIGPAVKVGTTQVNLAQASGAGGSTSNLAKAPVQIGDDFLSLRSLIMGRITTGDCDARDGVGSIGVEGIRVLLEDGTFVLSDKQGLFHFDGVRKGLHVVQLDPDSMEEWIAVSCTQNDRFAGRAFSQFVDVQGDTLWRADFHLEPKVKPKPPPPPPPPPPPAPKPAAPPPEPGQVGVSLQHEVSGLSAKIEAVVRTLRGEGHAVTLTMTLPAGVVYTPGSAQLEGGPIADPVIEGNTLTFALPPAGDGTRRVQIKTTVAEGTPDVTGPVQAVATAKGLKGEFKTPLAETTLQIAQEDASKPTKLVIRPHFAVLSDKFSDEDRAALDKLVKQLQALKSQQITVIGHTDGDKIRGNATKVFKDNRALSLARAASVAGYLNGKLKLPDDNITLIGRGELDPIASNKTKDGKALNRRVEVMAAAATKDMRTVLRSLKDHADETAASIGEPVAAAPGASAATSTISGATELVREAVSSSPAIANAVSSTVNTITAVPANAASSTAVEVAQVNAVAGTSTVHAAVATSVNELAAAPASSSTLASTGAVAAPAVTSTASAVPAPAAPSKPAVGILSPLDGELLPDRVGSVRVRALSYLTLALTVDDKPISDDRIGFKSEDPETHLTTLTYIGIEYGDRGTHTLALKGTDPFGNVRLDQKVTVTRTGEIAQIRFVSAEGNVADGKTPVRAKVEVLDAQGDVIHGTIRLEIREGTLQPVRSTKEQKFTVDDEVDGRTVRVDNQGVVTFAPVTSSGGYRAVLGAGPVTGEVELWVKPKM
ncbi:MAG: OmpA family protein, partial [Deltaproteobacteria bacterium]|nr:OmpA family protein [Deltaproteobacteria bacterium]